MGHCEQDRLWCAAAGDCICTCNRCYVARFETRNEMNAKLATAETRAERAEAQLPAMRKALGLIPEATPEQVAYHVECMARDVPRLNAEKVAQWERAERAEATAAKYKTALDAINVVRNSIVGLQRFGFSEHAYPLVAALDKAGIEGMPYDTARPHFEGLLGRALEAEATAKSLTAERDYLRAREAWLRRYAQAEVDDIEQVHEWLAANPEPQPPDGCAP